MTLRYKRERPATEKLDKMTEIRRENSGRGYPPYNWMEYAHSVKPHMNTVALAQWKVDNKVREMKFPSRPEKIKSWIFSFLGHSHAAAKAEDTRDQHESELKKQVGKSGISSLTNYPITVFNAHRILRDRIVNNLLKHAFANGRVLLHSNRASEGTSSSS